jgi:hypothetical protein
LLAEERSLVADSAQLNAEDLRGFFNGASFCTSMSAIFSWAP